MNSYDKKYRIKSDSRNAQKCQMENLCFMKYRSTKFDKNVLIERENALQSNFYFDIKISVFYWLKKLKTTRSIISSVRSPFLYIHQKHT